MNRDMNRELLNILPYDCLDYILTFFCVKKNRKIYYKYKNDSIVRYYKNINYDLDINIGYLNYLRLCSIDRIPEGLKVHTLIIYGCNIILEIPEGLKVNTLIINGYNTISEIPEGLKVNILSIYGFNNISEIPEGLKVHTLEICGLNTISEIPEGFKVHTFLIHGRNDFIKYHKD